MSAKIQLSIQEKALIKDTGWILTKQKITEKIYQLFGAFYEYQKEKIKSNSVLSSQLFTSSGKIYKGENYLGLPYIILDHPANFKKNNLFVIRTMCWWGNFISITLHVSGSHQSIFSKNKLQTFDFLQHKHFFICVNSNQWQHHFENDNYIIAKLFSLQKFEKMLGGEFLKVSKKISISEVDNAYDFLTNTFEEIIEMININFPGGEKVLSPVSPTTGSGL